LRILLVNWQDRENPQAGGAEILLHEVFGRLAHAGHEVTLLCGGWPAAPAAGAAGRDGRPRVGTRHTFPFLARRYYAAHLAAWRHDVLVEDVNKVPLFTPRWGARRTVAHVPHLFGGTAFREAPWPLAAAVWLAERPLARGYRGGAVPRRSRRAPRTTSSGAGVPRDAIRVIYPGIAAAVYTPNPARRAPAPLFAYLGRLKRYKGVDLVLRAFARVAHPDARLEVAGAGDHRPALERLAGELALGERVRFLGRISEAEKLDLLRRAWALAFASPKEGWGITNLEAAACGTPVVASDSPGIRESVRPGTSRVSRAPRRRGGDGRANERARGRQGARGAAWYGWRAVRGRVHVGAGRRGHRGAPRGRVRG
jgi:glycosyltransferase involved in cell wall biosynthesis